MIMTSKMNYLQSLQMRSLFISVPGCVDNSISITYWLQLVFGPFIPFVPVADVMELQTNVSVVGTTSSPLILLCYEIDVLLRKWTGLCILKYRYCKCCSFCLLLLYLYYNDAVLPKIRSNTTVCALSVLNTGGSSASFLSTADRRSGTEA